MVFDAALNTVTNGLNDHGLYLWSKGDVSLIARTGTVVAGVETISQLSPPAYVGSPYPVGYAVINDRGQVAFQALMTNGESVVLLASPHGRDE